MNFNKFKELINENKDNITHLYIYYILTVEEDLPKRITDNEIAMQFLILLIENTYLRAEQSYDLAFVCEVAAMYVDEIFEDDLNAEDLEGLCSETLLNC